MDAAALDDAVRRHFAIAAAHPDGLSLGILDSPLGPLLAATDHAAVVLLEFAEPARLDRQLQRLRLHFPMAASLRDSPLLGQLKRELQQYFDGTRTRFDVPLSFPGTPFQRRVWQQLLTIPYGETRAYEDLAAELGAVSAARAVGTANGSNRLAILIPCHRVVNKNGSLGGYGGGLWRKQHLLTLESAQRSLL
ncbi:methylated-DNA--[protein]-cysteine S-methyltransferase [Sinimarinibacterium sp. CAU 1509]|uniref:methylated-DNA--[protein]-cysteine S-methyltransferase n=1 Tax=Sinimarinibacterium sp. CAU 1509 TaxID=2562283 RepID=UPI0010ACC96B|nr:methylated-DNA--[protein]-cysteine S-methyltransferase [Sinimarinibacterium sp. CAU 1509]TJY59894.1 methylated-DNA--[protein]-cysteine S-methyltransferase [Sinimarinibacterium sp. CAU 1509]